MSHSDEPKTLFMRAVQTPWPSREVCGPELRFGDGGARLHFGVHAGSGRVTFEKLDSLRVSRGEYEPYDSDCLEHEVFPWVFVVEHSPWLQERYLYEAKFYGDAYEFSGDVDEMLRDYDHYVFMFKDEFVEAIAAGIWFQVGSSVLGDTEGFDDHPLSDLPDTCVRDRIEMDGVAIDVRVNPRPVPDLVRDAALCSQPLIHLASQSGLSTYVNWRLSLRSRAGKLKSVLRNSLGRIVKEYAGVADLSAIRPEIERWMAEVGRRRKEKRNA